MTNGLLTNDFIYMDFKLTKSDIYLILAYFAIAIPVACFDYNTYDNKMILFYETIFMVVMDSFCAYIIIYKIFPYFFPKRQYFQLMVVAVLFLWITGYFGINIYCLWESCKGNTWSLKASYIGLNMVIESFAILGLILLGKKLSDAQVNFLKVEKEKKESELLRLNAQIDPHFLFNNLNTVDSLIDTNPKVAKTYLNKLSKLYRYLISTKDQEVVELEEEIEFAQNYIYLIQSRFGNAFQFELNMEGINQAPLFIPPGALQTLLENIVKHNQPRPNEPVKSSIHLNADTIEVSNNLSIKTENVDSTGTGLTNLKARYKLLVDKEIIITTNGFFTVKLPLIKAVD